MNCARGEGYIKGYTMPTKENFINHICEKYNYIAPRTKAMLSETWDAAIENTGRSEDLPPFVTKKKHDREVGELTAEIERLRTDISAMAGDNCRLLEKVYTLRDKIERLQEGIEMLREDRDNLRADKCCLLAKIVRLREALEYYGEHEKDCVCAQYRMGTPTDEEGFDGYAILFGYGKNEKWYASDEQPPCVCGFSDALKEARER